MAKTADIFDIIKKYWDDAPVDVFEIIRQAGLKLEFQPVENDLSGWVEKEGPGEYSIGVNARHSPARQRFTAAHELGHLIYHRDLIGRGVDDNRLYRSERGGKFYNTNITSSHETQANRFAANLLMPQHLIDRLYKSAEPGQKPTPKDYADFLGVSEDAMRIRLNLPKSSELDVGDDDEPDPPWSEPRFG